MKFWNSQKNKKKTPMWRTLIEVLVLVTLVHSLIVRPFHIPSGSMKPNLLVGDYVVVNKFAYGYSRYSCYFNACPIEGRIMNIFGGVERGDVTVFSNPKTNQTYVKRIIGLPGDTIQMKESVLSINGTQVPHTKVHDFEEPTTDYQAGPCRDVNDQICYIDQYEEMLPDGDVLRVLNYSDDAYLDNTQEFTIPDGHYFVIGDNRDNSLDSRDMANGVGFLPEERLIGKASLIVFSSSGSSLFKFWEWRKDRFFKWVK